MSHRHLARRRAVATLLLLPVVAAGPALAQRTAARRYAVLSLVGDRYTVVEAREVTGTRLDRNRVQEVPIAGAEVDRAVFDEVGALVAKHDPALQPISLPVDDATLYTREGQQALFSGRFARLPDSAARAAKESGVTHVLLVTKTWERFAFEFEGGGTRGQGGAAGLGFYVEGSASATQPVWPPPGPGFLGIYTFIRGTVIDLNTNLIIDGRIVHGSEVDERTMATPAARLWSSLSEDDKLRALTRMLRKSVREGLGPMLVAR